MLIKTYVLENVEWKKYKRDRKNIIKALIKSLGKVLKKGGVIEGKPGLDFNELEDGVHEFRRTVRWLSIYPSSLGGMCRLSGVDNIDPSVKEFLRFASFICSSACHISITYFSWSLEA